MFQTFSSLKGLMNSSRRSTESLVFYLHYRVTFLVLVFCCILVSTQQFYGHKIQCLSKPSGGINGELLNSYCWAASTYSIYSSYLREAGIPVPHPGVASSALEPKHEYRNYYQYVHIILFIQAVLFYIPHLLWKSFENNFKTRLSFIINVFSLKTDDQDSKASALASFIEERWGTQKALVMQYLFCEVLSLFNLIAQLNLLNLFFNDKFLGLGLLINAYYGSAVLTEPIELFPLVTICSFHRYGQTGYINVIDSLCVLPNNALNVKIYLCLWVWFLVLLVLSIFSVIHLLFCVCVPKYRIGTSRGQILLLGRAGLDAFTTLLALGDFGDWFVLASVRRDLDALEFANLVEEVRERLCILETETKKPA